MDFAMGRTVRLGEIEISQLTPGDLLDTAVGERPQPIHYVSVNLDHVFKFGLSPLPEKGGRRNVYFADGWPIALACSIRTVSVWPRTAGSDLLPKVTRGVAAHGRSTLIIGAFANTHDLVRQHLGTLAEWVHFYAPTAGDLQGSTSQTEQVLASNIRGDTLLVLCLGKPLQERWYERFGDTIDAPIVLPVGGALEMWAGVLPRAPQWMRRTGLEWLFRLALEPRRLGRRYLLEGPMAVIKLIRGM